MQQWRENLLVSLSGSKIAVGQLLCRRAAAWLLPGELPDRKSGSACAGQSTAHERDQSLSADVKVPKLRTVGRCFPMRGQTCWSHPGSKLSTCQGHITRIARPRGCWLPPCYRPRVVAIHTALLPLPPLGLDQISSILQTYNPSYWKTQLKFFADSN